MIDGKPDQSQTRVPRKTNNLSVICISVLVLVALSCDRQEIATTETEIPRQTLSAFSMRHAEGGVLKWTLIGREAEFRLQTTFVRKPYVEIYENGQVVAKITAEHGEVVDQTQNLKFMNSVIATSNNGQLFSEELHWSNRDDRLYSPVACSIVRGESVVNGANAAARPNLEVIEMKEVTATLYEKDEKLNESE